MENTREKKLTMTRTDGSSRRSWILARRTATVLVVACASLLEAAAPDGWFLAGSHRRAYETGTEPRSEGEGTVAFLRSVEEVPRGFGTLMQTVSAQKYRGVRLRLSADLRSRDIETWAGMWMRVDGKTEGQSLAFDNMQDRPLRGTTEWKHYAVVLDIPQEAESIAFGFLISGNGQLWVDEVDLEEVDKSIPVTDRLAPSSLPEEPVNLEFGDP
ncbi:MAG: hypothetical protein K0U98_23635 [Deltaproteobacteria bacterium]|nr:hypothetical protein [Deltaproteobacteria bacterium]